MPPESEKGLVLSLTYILWDNRGLQRVEGADLEDQREILQPGGGEKLLQPSQRRRGGGKQQGTRSQERPGLE